MSFYLGTEWRDLGFEETLEKIFSLSLLVLMNIFLCKVWDLSLQDYILKGDLSVITYLNKVGFKFPFQDC